LWLDHIGDAVCVSDCLSFQLPPTHPIRLGLVLNMCVFLDEVLLLPDQANALALQVRDEPKIDKCFSECGNALKSNMHRLLLTSHHITSHDHQAVQLVEQSRETPAADAARIVKMVKESFASRAGAAAAGGLTVSASSASLVSGRSGLISVPSTYSLSRAGTQQLLGPLRGTCCVYVVNGWLPCGRQWSCSKHHDVSYFGLCMCLCVYACVCVLYENR